MSIGKNDLNKVNDYLWEIPQSFRGDMQVPARVYASEKMLGEIFRDRSLEQLVNVAALPGIQRYALAMPDIHEGYGFPVGGVAAFDAEIGVISPGGIGYDINCGVRLLRSEKTFKEVQPYLEKLGRTIYAMVPSGVGRGGRLVLRGKEFDGVLEGGARRVVEIGYGETGDLEHLESQGALENADASLVSEVAKSRGRDQLGTMGAGNHFVEAETVETIFDEEEAKRLGIFKDQVVILIHTGSRGLGHQIATDYIRVMMKAMPKYGISLPDRELACAPFNSPEGQNYFHAMAAGANFAWANRQLITWEARKAWEEVLGIQDGALDIIYDVAHNIAKVEEYEIATSDKKQEARKLVIHRKGATRSFPGQPVLIPGSMGTGSYLLVGQERAMEESFGSTCHGAGRRMSRTQARKGIRSSELKQKLNERGIAINTGSLSGLAEEAPSAYKDVDEVVEIVHQAGIAKKVARFRPLTVVKG
jgi:tRNA-splicing ligase RtcB